MICSELALLVICSAVYCTWTRVSWTRTQTSRTERPPTPPSRPSSPRHVDGRRPTNSLALNNATARSRDTGFVWMTVPKNYRCVSKYRTLFARSSERRAQLDGRTPNMHGRHLRLLRRTKSCLSQTVEYHKSTLSGAIYVDARLADLLSSSSVCAAHRVLVLK